MASAVQFARKSWWTGIVPVVTELRARRLHRAVELAEQAGLRGHFFGRMIARSLTRRLLKNAFWNWEQTNHLAAWSDFAMADRIVPDDLSDWVAAEKNQLVETTILACDQMLESGQAGLSIDLLDQLSTHKILDWRADRIRAAAKLICQSQELAQQGHWSAAIQKLDLAKQQRADLHYLPARMQTLNELRAQHLRLTQLLKQAICGKRLEAARYLADQLLAISPADQVALAARRKLTAVNNGAANIRLVQATHVPIHRLNNDSHGTEASFSNRAQTGVPESLLMWIDGVGGFLVCTSPSVWAGCYVDQPRVDIPIQGDLRRRHLRFELHHDQFVLAPIGPVSVNGSSLDNPVVLRDGQTIDLTGQIRWGFRQPHPLSSSARIDFTSPHRTVPWSDAILLMADTLIIGPHRKNHVYCPDWRNDLILFRQQGKLFVRSDCNLIVDGKQVGSVAPILSESSISGDDFSIKLEPVFQPN